MPVAELPTPATPLERLRWHEGLRRRWREARVEAAIRAAWSCSRIEGVAYPAKLFRAELVAGGGILPDDAGGNLARGHLRLMVHVDSLLPPLGGPGGRRLAPAPQLLTSLHRAACAGIIADGEVGRPIADPLLVAEMITDIGRAGEAAGTAIGLVAKIHADIVNHGVFAHGNIPVAWGLSRLLLVTSGTDPTGVAVPELTFAADPQAYRAVVAGPQEEWLAQYRRALDEGAFAGREIADMVLAGRIGAVE